MAKYHIEPNLLRKRVVLLTGAGDGIGAAVAEALAAYGARVILLGRTLKKLENVYTKIVDAGHPVPLVLAMELRTATENHYEALAKQIEQKFGRLDGLIHNAAVLGTLTPIQHYDARLWAHIFHVNVHAAFMLTKACLPLLKLSREASILFSSANVGHRGQAYWGAYAASKAATDNLAQVLAEELEVNTSVRVNCIDPGAVRTRMHSLAYPGKDPIALLDPTDITKVYLYLMGPNSSGITGERFHAQDR